MKKEVIHVASFLGGVYDNKETLYHYTSSSSFFVSISLSLSLSLVLFTKESLIAVIFETVKQTKKKVKKVVIQNNA